LISLPGQEHWGNVNVRNVIEMTTYREVILHLIEVNQGLKLTDLTLKVMSEANPQNFKGDIYHLELTRLILERESSRN
jgi:hypothetical protein